MPEPSKDLAEAPPNKATKSSKPIFKNKAKKQSKRKSPPRVIVSAEQLPRKSLEQALVIGKTLREVFAGGPANWEQIAQAMKVAPKNTNNKYPLWAALAYNVVQKDQDNFLLSELGRKILAPTTPNEDKEAIVQAVLTPVILPIL